jgi:hypothetical protein
MAAPKEGQPLNSLSSAPGVESKEFAATTGGHYEGGKRLAGVSRRIERPGLKVSPHMERRTCLRDDTLVRVRGIGQTDVVLVFSKEFATTIHGHHK